MRKALLFFGLMIIAVFAQAAFVKDMPVVRLQPNGDTLHCFVTGDEYYHRLHDAQGFTIVQNSHTGYYVYAVVQNGELTGSNYIVGSVNPATVGITPNLTISQEAWSLKQKAWDIPAQYAAPTAAKTGNTNRGTINNIVIFIRFAGDAEISTSMSSINAMFNDSTSGSTSMYNYFKHASYGQLHIPTFYYPAPNNGSVVSYQDTFARSYYMPYDSTTNTNGYSTSAERASREFGLLERAVNYVNSHSAVSSSLNIDYDNDGYVDNICFVVKGTYTGWSDLLWPHKWSLYDRYVYINGKRVYTFNLQLEGSGSHYFSSSTFCHEMFHTLGAPDLYRYNVRTNVSCVGNWDLMGSNTTPPQHMDAYMKYRYGNWIDSIPEITVPGTYTLNSLADSANVNNCYKIASADPNQWYVLEYRDNTELFETGLSNKGLLIFRIDTRYTGNAGYDGVTDFDEVYLFRPNAFDDSTNGNYSQACFSSNSGRTSFIPNGNPYPWLTGNIIDTTLSITNISAAGNTISFTYINNRGCTTPDNLASSQITNTTAHLSWYGHSGSYRVAYRPMGSSLAATSLIVNGSSSNLVGLTPNTRYEWNVRSLCDATDSSEQSVMASFQTISCSAPLNDTIGTADTSLYIYPINTYYNYSHTQQIVTAAEMGTPLQISAVKFLYTNGTPLTSKTNCTIYVAHTTMDSYTSYSQAVACSTMTKVYEGPMVCSQGWNEFMFDTLFAYNGTDNLLIAVEDNSADYNNSSCKFADEVTDTYKSLAFYSDTRDPDPNDLASFSGNKRMNHFRSQMQFVGCPPPEYYTLTVNSADTTKGFTSGEGIYEENATVTIAATALPHYHFTMWNDSNTANPRTIVATADSTFTASFAADDYTLIVASGQPLLGSTEGSGTYSYLSQVTLTATAFDGGRFVAWNDSVTANPRTITVTQDSSFTALFESTASIDEFTTEPQVRVFVSNHNINITGANGKPVQVIDLKGRIIATTTGADKSTIHVSVGGVYLVRIGDMRTEKVVVF